MALRRLCLFKFAALHSPGKKLEVENVNRASDGLPSLAVLRLRHTRVTSLAPLASVLTLEELDIAHTAVADISVLGRLPALASLDLRASAVTDLAVLAGMAALRRIVVQRLDVDPAAIDRLREVRPDVELIT